jgi:SpoVK/Ycf46/Vps4 family AAA+-type ATPase
MTIGVTEPAPAREADGEAYASSAEHLWDEIRRIDGLVRGQALRALHAAGADLHRGLAVSDEEALDLLRREPAAPPWAAAPVVPSLEEAHEAAARAADDIARRVQATTGRLRLAELARRFSLDRFDLDVFLVALAPELDLRYERLYAYLHDDITRKRPSVDLALHLLCPTLEARFAARARFGAEAPLRQRGLLLVTTEPQDGPRPLLAASLKVDDRVVDWLHGSAELEARLARHARRQLPRASLDDLLVDAGSRRRVRRLADDMKGVAAPLVYLHGPRGAGQRAAAEALARELGRRLLVVDGTSFDAGDAGGTAEAVVEAAAREAELESDILYVDGADIVLSGARHAARSALVRALASARVPVVLSGETSWGTWDARDANDAFGARAPVTVLLRLPDSATQVRLWRRALATARRGRDVDVEALVARFQLSGDQIDEAVAAARARARFEGGVAAPVTMTHLAEACRERSGHRLGELAHKVPAGPSWDDLVLPDDHLRRLREISAHERHRALVLERWGFARKLPGGKGLGVLFAGPPGTGKTLAASVIAAELGLDLYRIDLSSIVSKWLGETEKHLARVFDEAERGRVALLFDEADALFGKRSDVRDAHDRYANVETSYLLQRLEAHEGVVILASNFRRNIDEAFVRRLRFIVEFPLPDERERLRIWERMIPPETPRAPDVDLGVLARRFELAGAHIRNVALAAAFLAAADEQPLGQGHLLQAARREHQKLGKIVDQGAFRP